MKLVYPDIDHVFDTSISQVNILVIENQKLLKSFIEDLSKQVMGLDGNTVVSNNEKVLDFNKNVELIKDYFPFEINRKSLLNKITNKLVCQAIEYDYENMMEVIGGLESFLNKQIVHLAGDLYFSKLDFESLLKASGLSINEEYTSLCEKLLEYMELVREYEKDKLFVYLNLRNYIDDNEIKSFFDTVLRHQYHVLMIEGSVHTQVDSEKCYIIDQDLCEIAL